MRWNRWTVQPFLEVRIAALNNTLRGSFQRDILPFKPRMSVAPCRSQRDHTTPFHALFRDEECRIRTDNAPANFATSRHMAHNRARKALGKDSTRLRRKAASRDDE